jgi:hypothetical protein
VVSIFDQPSPSERHDDTRKIRKESTKKKKKNREKERKERELTSLVADNRIEHDAFRKLVRLAATHDGYAPFPQHHGDEGGPGSRKHGAVREEGVRPEEAERDAREDERERGEEDVGGWDRGEAEGMQEVLACPSEVGEGSALVSFFSFTQNCPAE